MSGKNVTKVPERDPTKMTYEIIRRYLSDNKALLGPVLYDRMVGYVRSRNVQALVTAREQVGVEYCDVNLYRVLYQVESFLKKNDTLAGTPKTRTTAIAGFLENEAACAAANRRISNCYFGLEEYPPDVELWLVKMERWIDWVLGPFETFLRQLPELVRFTDGASASRPRRESRKHLKVSLKMPAPKGAHPYLESLAKYWGFKRFRARTCSWNRLEFVTKNWNTDRTIACEADGALPLQLAFDSFGKAQLRHKTRIDLRNQSTNRSLAQKGSVTGKTATVDLTSASDLNAYEAIARLFPAEWFRFLDAVRASHYIGSDVGAGKYQKFSSMGNGTTFVIETIVFAAAAFAVGSTTVSVYGDDIVIDSECVEDLARLLGFLGHKVNMSKSYSAGPFRESCGGSYYDGIDVTPFFLRTIPRKGGKHIMCHVVNGLAAIAVPEGSLWQYLREIVYAERLRLVPRNFDSMSGVFLDPYHAYRLGLIRMNRERHYPQAKVYVIAKPDKKDDVVVPDWRGLFLWYLESGKPRKPILDEDDTLYSFLVRSRDPSLAQNYRAKWVCWRPPAGETPPHLFWWGEYLTSGNTLS